MCHMWKALIVVWMINIPHSLGYLNSEYSVTRKDGKNNVNGSQLRSMQGLLKAQFAPHSPAMSSQQCVLEKWEGSHREALGFPVCYRPHQRGHTVHTRLRPAVRVTQSCFVC